ncbi:MAG TPA: FAD-dependent oxidoreductase, partial [Solirubrobacteraceae bacterium]|nr:FAD-dependent oxidoreductase [Solirubrobacteraceae bacterium]
MHDAPVAARGDGQGRQRLAVALPPAREALPRLAQGEQKAAFSLIPALARAEFLRYGSIHRNSYLDSPALLDAELR